MNLTMPGIYIFDCTEQKFIDYTWLIDYMKFIRVYIVNRIIIGYMEVIRLYNYLSIYMRFIDLSI